MAKVYQHLDMGERALIETQLAVGMKPSAIAMGLMRSGSTVTRAMHRNGWKPPSAALWHGQPGIAGGYRSLLAEERARRLAAKPRVACKLVAGNPLWVLMVEHLRAGLSPAQNRAHTGTYAHPCTALLRDDLHRALRHAARRAALQPAGAPCAAGIAPSGRGEPQLAVVNPRFQRWF